MGGKYKKLPQILPLLPQDISIFVDLFCGGCNIAINVPAKTKICNDVEPHIIDLYQNLLPLTGPEATERILSIVKKYGLSKTNKDGFLKCRHDYNKSPSWDLFYSLITHAFNYQIRFNAKGEYNMPFGTLKSHFNPSLQDKLTSFVDELTSSSYIFSNKDFRSLSNIPPGAFVYCDPPYLISTAPYNENGQWTEQDERDLLIYLDSLDNKQIRFALSNVLEHNGKSNNILKEWSSKYNIHTISGDYSNSNYKKKDRSSNTTLEVLITNY